MEVATSQSTNPLPDPLDIRACDEFFEALADGEVEF